MRNKAARQILEETPADVRQFVQRYGEIVVRVHALLEEKGWTQKDLANRIGKSPSEISKWLNGEHNFTLRSLAKLEAELGEEIINIPKRHSFHVQSQHSVHLTIYRNDGGRSFKEKEFNSWDKTPDYNIKILVG